MNFRNDDWKKNVDEIENYEELNVDKLVLMLV